MLCSFVEQGDPTGKACGLIEQALRTHPEPRTSPFSTSGSGPARVVEPIDPTLGGLVEVTR